MQEELRREMNRIWQLRTVEFVSVLGDAFHKVSRGERVPPEHLAAIIHRLYSMLQGELNLLRECYALMMTYRFVSVGEDEQYDIAERLKTVIEKMLEAKMEERDAFTWLAQRPSV